MNAQRALDKLSFVASGFHPFVFDIQESSVGPERMG
jgi:hypothetical protein